VSLHEVFTFVVVMQAGGTPVEYVLVGEALPCACAGVEQSGTGGRRVIDRGDTPGTGAYGRAGNGSDQDGR
jgi:hypothetical protein